MDAKAIRYALAKMVPNIVDKMVIATDHGYIRLEGSSASIVADAIDAVLTQQLGEMEKPQCA